MTTSIEYRDLGRMRFADAWELQQSLQDEMLQDRKMGDTHSPTSYLLFVEHPHVFTLGKSGNQGNLLISDKLLKQHEAEYFHIDRGGDITYHGPGQIVGYPLLDLWKLNYGVKEYIHRMEDGIIRCLQRYDINAGRLDNATGVWLDAGRAGKERKICAIGVKVSRGLTMHGFAFNVNTDLEYFNLINPCGFTDKSVTSMQRELGTEQDMEEVKRHLKQDLAVAFGVIFSQP